MGIGSMELLFELGEDGPGFVIVVGAAQFCELQPCGEGGIRG